MKERYKFRDIVVNILLGLVILLFLFSLVYHRFFVPSSSMENTIHKGDIILTVNVGKMTKLNRGDICVFKKTGETMLLVKRIIGLPGEKVEMIDGIVYIDGKKLQEDYVSSKCDTNMVFYVPEDSYLFLGDNRANSSDARYWANPYIKRKYIKSRVFYRLVPTLEKIK